MLSTKEDLFNYSIYPWESSSEFINFYETLFSSKEMKNINNNISNNLDIFISSLSLENLKLSMKYLIKWDSRGDNKIFCLPILLLVNALIKLKEKKINNKDINSSHILAEVIIRVINIIMDQLRKNKKVNNLNMYIIGKTIELPEFIIDIRHACTHKNLPNFNQLSFAIEYIFFWIKIKLIDPKYNKYIQENKFFFFLLNLLNNCDNYGENIISKNIHHEYINLEPEHLLTIITHLFINIKKNFIYNKAKNTISYNNTKIKYLIDLFLLILEKEKEIFILMIFSFIYQQIAKINSNSISNEKKNEYKLYLINFCKILYNNIPKKINFNLKKYEILYLSIFNNLSKIKKEYNTIFDIFNNIFKYSNKNDDLIIEESSYVDLDKIEGNIYSINLADINKMINIDNNYKKDKLNFNKDENEINEALNKDIRDDYNNFNSIII